VSYALIVSLDTPPRKKLTERQAERKRSESFLIPKKARLAKPAQLFFFWFLKTTPQATGRKELKAYEKKSVRTML